MIGRIVRAVAFVFVIGACSGSAAIAAATASDILIVPGKSVGPISLGMTPAAVTDAMGKPEREQAGSWVEYKETIRRCTYFFVVARLQKYALDQRNIALLRVFH